MTDKKTPDDFQNLELFEKWKVGIMELQETLAIRKIRLNFGEKVDSDSATISAIEGLLISLPLPKKEQ